MLDGVVTIRSVHDFARDMIFARYLRRRLHHHSALGAQDEGRGKCEPRRADRAQHRNTLAQVVAREAYMTRFFGDVDLHYATKQRMNVLAILAQYLALHVIDRIFPGQHEDEKQLRELERVPDHELCTPTFEPAQSWNVEAGPIDEFLEHQRVLRLFDGLVIAIAKLRRTSRQPAREIQQAALEHVLEDHPNLHEVGQHMKTDSGSNPGGLRAVPFGRTEYVIRFEFPSRVVGIDAEIGIVPINVRVRIEMLHYRLTTKLTNEIEIAVVVNRSSDDALQFGNNRFPDH